MKGGTMTRATAKLYTYQNGSLWDWMILPADKAELWVIRKPHTVDYDANAYSAALDDLQAVIDQFDLDIEGGIEGVR